MALGHDVLGTLDDLVARYPLREHLAAVRMLALYRAGRQADALTAYRTLRQTLDDELGIQPSAEVESLHQRVLQQDPGLDLVLPEAPDGTVSDLPAHPNRPRRQGADLPGRGGVAGLSRRGWAAVTAIVLVAAVALVGAIFLAPSRIHALAAQQRRAGRRRTGLQGDAVTLDSAPSALTSGGGAVWAVLDNTDAVVKIDPRTRKVAQTIPSVGRLAAGGGCQRRRPVGGRVRREGPDPHQHAHGGSSGRKIPVGNGPAAVIAGPDGVWVANSSDNTVQRVDPRTEKADPAIAVGDGPDALALDGSTLWVANGRSGTVSQIDTRTGQPAASDIRVEAGAACAGGHRDGRLGGQRVRPVGLAGCPGRPGGSSGSTSPTVPPRCSCTTARSG